MRHCLEQLHQIKMAARFRGAVSSGSGLVRCLTVAAALIFSVTVAHAQSNPASVDETFRLEATRSSEGDIRLAWKIAPDSYLYRDRISVARPGGEPLAVETPAGTEKDDPTFGLTQVYEKTASAVIRAGASPASGAIEVLYQGCNEKLGVCYPPERKTLDLATLAIAATTGGGLDAEWIDRPAREAAAIVPDTAPSIAAPLNVDAWLRGGMLPLLAAFLGFGLLLTFTPCVLPMIPILSGMLVRSGAHTPARGFTLSLVYVLAMASAYALLGVVAAWSGQNLQAALQTSWALGAMSILFAVLALSMFGLFELQVPSFIANRISAGGPRAGGSLSGAAFLGFTSALIVGPCVTPPLAGALLYVSQTGDVMRGASALFALGLGMGLPLVAWGTFGPKALPRSGAWLVMVRQAFGVLFLAVAIVMASRVLPGPMTLALWALLAIGVGVFLGAFERRGREALPRLARSAGIAAVVYGGALLVGAAGGAEDPLQPLGFLARDAGAAGATAAEGTRVTTLPAFEKAVLAGRAGGKPVVVAFTADWCTTCKVIERKVFANPGVLSRLADAALIHVDVTRNDADSRALMRRFEVVGPPTILFIDAASGDEVPAARVIGDIDAPGFLHRFALAGA